jgi:hypothetical protein
MFAAAVAITVFFVIPLALRQSIALYRGLPSTLLADL